MLHSAKVATPHPLRGSSPLGGLYNDNTPARYFYRAGVFLC